MTPTALYCLTLLMRKLHMVSKATVFFGTVASALLFARPFSLGIFLVAWVCPCVIAAGARRAVTPVIVRLIFPTYAMLLLVYGVIAVPPGVQPEIRIGSIGVNSAGIVHGTIIAARLLAIAAASISLAVSASPIELAAGLRSLGVPVPAAAAFTASFGLLSIARRRIGTIMDAQRSRGALASRNPFKRAYAFIPILRPLTFALMQGAVDRAVVWNHRRLLQTPSSGTEPLVQLDWLVLALTATVFSCAVLDRWVS